MIKLLEKIRFFITPGFYSIVIPSISIVFLIAVSCSKPVGTIGIDIQPEDSKLNLRYSDTTTIYAYSSPKDSVRSERLTWNTIGSLKDPVFGTTNTGFYTQFFLSEAKKDFGPNPVVDSLILQMRYYGLYGDTNTMLTAHVYEMGENIDFSEVYYSNLQLQVYPQDYGNINFLPRPNDSVILGDDTIPPVLRMNISNYNSGLAEKLIAADTNIMEDSDIFRDYFKGLYVIAEPVSQDGSIAQFDLASNVSGMSLYYHHDTADSLVFAYLITSAAARVSQYQHDFNTADQEFKQQVVEGDTLLGANKFYVQGFGGVRTTIKVPHIEEWRKQGNIAINEAKLVLSGYETEPYLGAPQQLAIYAKTEDGKDDYLIDYYEGDTYFGGDYHGSSNSYTFRITRYMQSLISDTTLKHYGFSLYVSSPWLTPNRFIFNGHQSDSSSRIRLEVLYTDLD